MSAFSAVVDRLQDDATLAALLTGGVYDGESTPTVNRQATPDAFDAFGEMLPCALVKAESATPWGPLHDSGRLYLLVWLYDQHDYTVIETARNRVYTLLHREKVSGADLIYDVRHANDVLGAEVQGLEVAMIASRFVVTVQRG